MAPSNFSRAARWPIPAVALATLTFGQSAALAQTVTREYDDGRVETFSWEERRFAPLRRPRPRDFDDDDADERFERDDWRRDDSDVLDDDDFDDRQGQLDFAPGPANKPPPPPPSVDARPSQKAWKPAL
jgi:hypothetical protein